MYHAILCIYLFFPVEFFFVAGKNGKTPNCFTIRLIQKSLVTASPLCFDHTRFTLVETKAILTLWALVQAPLILGGDVMTLPDDVMAAVRTPITASSHVWLLLCMHFV
jgi:hypothetical protein